MHELKKENPKLVQANKNLTDSIAAMEMERASNILRFQNIPEDKQEDLPELMAAILAEALGIGKEELENEIDQKYRLHSSYAKKNRIPREVHIKFVKGLTRDEVLQRTTEDPIQYRQKEIVVLKQIPWRIREGRKQYHFLTTKLDRKGVNFRWLVPKAREFLEKHITFFEAAAQGQDINEEESRKQREKTPEEESELSEEESRKKDIGQDLDKIQREKRNTRATKPKYK